MSKQITAQDYALALLVEECGEIMQLLGKAGRFGIDTPGVKDPLTGHVDMSVTSRVRLNIECGDILAAIDYAVAAGVIEKNALKAGATTYQPDKQPYKNLDGVKEVFSLYTLMIACSRLALSVGEMNKLALGPTRMFPPPNRLSLLIECQRLLDAISRCEKDSVLDADIIARQHDAKLAKLLDPKAVDNLGRRLAPEIG